MRRNTSKPREFGWPAALAAGFVVASVSALLTWGLMREPDPAAQRQIAGSQAAETAIMPVNYGPNSGITAKELVARDELLVQFREKFGQLRPETREAIVKNLAVIQTRGGRDRCGTRKGPGERDAERASWSGAYKQELQLYSTVVTAVTASRGEPEMSIPVCKSPARKPFSRPARPGSFAAPRRSRRPRPG